MVQIRMLSDEWLLRCTPIEKLYPKFCHTYKGDLDFELVPSRGMDPGVWSHDVNANPHR